MKRLGSLFGSFLFLFISTSCKDGEVQLTPDLAASVQLQIVQEDSGSMLAQVSDPSGLVDQYDLYAFVTVNDTDSDLEFVKRVTDFPSEERIRKGTLAAIFGMPLQDFALVESVTFVGVVTAKDGEVFRAYPPEESNIGQGMLASANQPWVRELPFCDIETRFVGPYDIYALHDVGDSFDYFGPPLLKGLNVGLEESGEFSRTVELLFLDFFPVEMEIDLRCEAANLKEAVDTEVGCGGPTIVFEPASGGTFDLSNDDEFSFYIQYTLWACGWGADTLMSEVRFRKTE